MSKKKTRNWSTPLEESHQEALNFAQGICVSLSIMKLLNQLEELEAQGVEINETYKTNLLITLLGDAPQGSA